MPDSVYESVLFQRYQEEEIFPSHTARLMRKRHFSFLPCERVETKSTNWRQDGEVGVADKVVWKNSHKTMLRPNESTRWFDFLKNTYPSGIANCSVMHVAYQDLLAFTQLLSIHKLPAVSIDWRWGKKSYPKFLSDTVLTTSAQPVALNTACASFAALKGGCPP